MNSIQGQGLLREVAGVAQTGADWTPLLQRLGVMGPDNDSRVVSVDLTQEHTEADPFVIDVAGLNVTILDVGSGEWSLRFNAITNDAYPSTIIQRGDRWEQEFQRLYVTNPATPGASPLWLHIGRRV